MNVTPHDTAASTTGAAAELPEDERARLALEELLDAVRFAASEPTLEACGERLGISRERVRQHLVSGLAKLRMYSSGFKP